MKTGGKMLKKSIAVLAIILGISGCGGGGSSSGGGTTIATGQFKDSNIAGLSYVSGEQSGITAADGGFTYEVGETVTFSIGGVTVGTADGKSVVTPVDLVAGGSSSSVEVQNIVRFLMMLDDDGVTSNGINISSPVQTIAEDWLQVDFSATDLSSELTSIISDAISEDNGTHVLPDDATAKTHLESTLLCSYAGAYKGTWSGDDHGTFGFMVDASNGDVTGAAYSIPFDETFGLFGTTPISYDQDATFVSGGASGGGTFDGRFTSVDGVAGTWEDTSVGESGVFSGTRIGGAKDATHRFTGTYSGDDSGLISFDVDGSNNVTGVVYSVIGDELFTMSGSVEGTTLTATTSDGAEATGTLDTSTGTLSGTWSDSVEGASGSFSGSGCKLN